MSRDAKTLQLLIDNGEHSDAELHKLYNNLGLAHFAARDFRAALRAHNAEKSVCKRLLARATGATARRQHLGDLAIAYRRCGDAMIKLPKLLDHGTGTVIRSRPRIIALAQRQHKRGLRAASRAHDGLEEQAASAALGQSTLMLALTTKARADFIRSLQTSLRAARLVSSLNLPESRRVTISLGIALNFAIALSEVGQRQRARDLLHAVALRATAVGDGENAIRAISNLSEEAGNDGDWPLSAALADRWATLAREAGDGPDECDALRKLAVARREAGDLKGAENAARRAAGLATADEQRAECADFLAVIRREAAEARAAEFALSSAVRRARTAERDGDFSDQARAALAAGAAAYTLKKTDDVVKHYTTYFRLVDEYGCAPVVTGVAEVAHNSAVVNMGECMWNLRRYKDAVDWATRELALYDGDIPGQAQAWCNLGVYLDDYGQKDRAIEALRKSAALAAQCGEDDTRRRAEENLDILREELAEPEGTKSGVDKAKTSKETSPVDVDIVEVAVVPPQETARSEDAARSERRGSTGSQKRKLSDDSCSHSAGDAGVTVDCTPPQHGEKSIVMTSIQATKKTRREWDAESVHDGARRSCASATRPSMARAVEGDGEHSSSARSREASTTTHTATNNQRSQTLRNIVDLPREYKAARVRLRAGAARPAVVSALRELASALVARESVGAGVESMGGEAESTGASRLNLSGVLLVGADDARALADALRVVPAPPHAVCLDVGLNPLVSASALVAAAPLPAVRQLDLSCAAVPADVLPRLAPALPRLTDLNIARNSLGRFGGKSAAASIAALLAAAPHLRSLDLSANMLPADFVPALAAGDTGTSALRTLGLSMNNRRAPTALLEVDDPLAVAGAFRALFDSLEALEVVNVRACGATPLVRSELRRLSEDMADSSRTIVTVADEHLHDDF